MIGAIIGDIIGSVYEFEGIKTKEIQLFCENSAITDDSILTIAIFCALERCKNDYNFLSRYTVKEFVRWYSRYPDPMGSYGAGFLDWIENSIYSKKIQPPYNSCGNGAAMRISPVAYFAKNLEECKKLSYRVTVVTHNHPEGIKGAESTAVAIYMALHGSTKEDIKDYIVQNYYQLDKSCDEIRKTYKFDATAQGTVPQCIQAFLESENYEDAIRLTISLGGDADTMGAITGAIAEAYYGISEEIEDKLQYYIDEYSSKTIAMMIEKRNTIGIRRKKI